MTLARPDDSLSSPERPDRSGWLALGGVLAALGASSCCVLPFVLFTVGVGGAWLGNLTALSPYQPLFLALGLALVCAGFWAVYRRPAAQPCATEDLCARPASRRLSKIALWAAAALILAAFAFPYVAPVFLDL